jgi:hypothetical protein
MIVAWLRASDPALMVSAHAVADQIEAREWERDDG